MRASHTRQADTVGSSKIPAASWLRRAILKRMCTWCICRPCSRHVAQVSSSTCAGGSLAKAETQAYTQWLEARPLACTPAPCCMHAAGRSACRAHLELPKSGCDRHHAKASLAPVRSSQRARDLRPHGLKLGVGDHLNHASARALAQRLHGATLTWPARLEEQPDRLHQHLHSTRKAAAATHRAALYGENATKVGCGERAARS
jgi:hypothetical protein